MLERRLPKPAHPRADILPAAIVLCLSLAAGSFMLRAALARYWAGGAFVLDFGFYRNALALLAAGRLFPVSPVFGYPVLADHLSFILYPLALIYRVFPHAATLFAIQAFGLALAALPLYALGRRWAGDRAVAALLAVMYLAAPWVWSADLFDFHPETLFPLALFSALLLAERRRFAFAAVLLLVAVALKEVLTLTVLGVGIWWAIAHRAERAELRFGLAAAVGALLAAILDRGLQSLWSPAHAAFLAAYFGALLGGHRELLPGLWFALTHPSATALQLAVADKWGTLGRVLMASGFMGLLDPAGLLALLPGALVTLGADRWPVAAGGYAEALPFGTASFAAAAGALRIWPGIPRTARALTIGCAIALSAASAAIWTSPALRTLGAPPGSRMPAGLALLKKVPAQAPLAVPNDGIGALASGRTRLYLLPGTIDASADSFYAAARRAQYLLYQPMTDIPTAIAADPKLAAANLRAMGYVLEARRAGWVLWRRVRPGSASSPRICRAVGPWLPLAEETLTLRPMRSRTTNFTLQEPAEVRMRAKGSGWILLDAVSSGNAADAQYFSSEVVWIGRGLQQRADLAPGRWQWISMDPASATGTEAVVRLSERTLTCP